MSPLVEISAPGSQILSSAADGYYKLDGTSMASPHVAGLFTLLRAQNPGASVAQLEEAILKTGKSVTDPRTGTKTILPDAEQAMLALAGADAQPKPDEPKPDEPKPDEPKPDEPKPDPNQPDPRVSACGTVCIEEGKDMRRIIFVLARGQAVTAETIALLKTSFGPEAQVQDIGDGKLLVELPVQPKSDDIDKARKGVGDGTRVLPDEPLKALQPGETIQIK
jgi:hypothetical protein